ncbi:MAG: hypothetical protein PHP69_06430 [Candidatus Omnitrophica bacterium]|nr:hypothetical protein [Candidatus Omnitrophota bacterium]MDD5440674.1 hypothetical protein [Candidatus Omnitrophota bacterium]
MRKITVFLIAMLTISALANAQFNENLNVTPEEIFVGVYPKSQYVELIEYNILSTRTEESKATNDILRIKSLVEKGDYCKEKYGFKYFQSVEEEIKKDRGFVEIHCNLVTQNKNLIEVMKDVFGKVLKRDVEITISKEDIGLHFYGNYPNIGGNNSAFTKKDSDQRAVFWKNGTPNLEAIFSIKQEERIPLVDKLDGNAKSPEISIEEINKLKFDSKPIDFMLKPFQDDADIYRLRHVKYYGELIEEYQKKVGKLPFQGEADVPINVFIANSEQEQYVKDENPFPHETRSCKSFIEELEKGLGRKIDEYYDPQFAPVDKPNFYIYMVEDDTYYFAVHISQYYGFAYKVGEHYYKVEITNKPVLGCRAFALNDLVANEKYTIVAEAVPMKEEFFEDREKQFLNETKR